MRHFCLLGAVGWPLVQRGYSELRVSYAEARATFKQELPTLMKAKKVLPQLFAEKREAEVLLRDLQPYVPGLPP